MYTQHVRVLRKLSLSALCSTRVFLWASCGMNSYTAELSVRVTQNHKCLYRDGGWRWWRATKWQAKALSKLKQLHISYKVAESTVNFISWSCNDLQAVVCLSRQDGAIQDHLSTHEHLTSLKTSHSNNSLGNFQHQ